MDVYSPTNASELRSAFISLAQALGVCVARDNSPPYQIFGQISQLVSFSRMDGNYSAVTTTARGNQLQILVSLWEEEPVLVVTVRTKRGKMASVKQIFRRGGKVDEYKEIPSWFHVLNDPELQTVKTWVGGVTCARTAFRPITHPPLRSALTS